MLQPNIPTAHPVKEPWLVALDIDGTILGYGGSLSNRVGNAIRSAAQAGHHVVIASGRDLVGTRPILQMLGINDGWMVCSNGCVVVRVDPEFGAGYWIEQVSTFDAAPVLNELVKHLPNARFAVEDVGKGYRVTKPFNDGELAGTVTVVPFDHLASGNRVTRVVVRGGDDAPQELSEAVAKLGLSDVGYFVGYNAWMDLAPAGVNKASALEHVREQLGIPQQRTIAIGDGHNDIEMLTWATRGIAMGQSDDEVKAAAAEVTGSVKDDGVAIVLETLLASVG
jgi:Cof subfamily protein (haloacid dehalogenase superfamily)